MQETYFCPNCGVSVKYTDKFCGYCGLNLNRDMRTNNAIVAEGKHSSVSAPVKPISDEISKLLADFFNKRLNAT
jgi:predicted amidophosphoribosyltransferase